MAYFMSQGIAFNLFGKTEEDRTFIFVYFFARILKINDTTLNKHPAKIPFLLHLGLDCHRKF